MLYIDSAVFDNFGFCDKFINFNMNYIIFFFVFFSGKTIYQFNISNTIEKKVENQAAVYTIQKKEKVKTINH